MLKVLKWFQRERVDTLKICMRSGNSFTIDGVVEFEVTGYTSGTISNLRLVQSDNPKYSKVLMPSLDLSQVEAIVRVGRP